MSDDEKLDFPNAWKDDERCAVLFAPFRPRNVNPENYDNKLEFWHNLIHSLCKATKNPKFSKQLLENSFKRKNKTPSCLDLVIEDMATKYTIRKENDFISDSTISWTGWAVNNFVKNPVKWGLSKIISINNNDISNTTEFIHLTALNELSEELRSSLRNFEGKVFSIQEFKEVLSENHLNYHHDGLMVCLVYLHCKKQIVTDYTFDKEIKINVVKVSGINSSKDQITDVDRTKIKLQNTKKILLKNIQIIEIQIKNADMLVRHHLKEHNKILAKMYLKKKHTLENNCGKFDKMLKLLKNKKCDVLNNIETLISNIEDAENSGDILNAYKMGSDVLKSITSNTGLTNDSVDEIMLTLKETLDDNQDIQNSMANIDTSNDSILEQELEDMLKSDVITDDVDDNFNPPPSDSINSEFENAILQRLYKLKVADSELKTAVSINK